MATNGKTTDVTVRRRPFQDLEEFFGARWPFDQRLFPLARFPRFAGGTRFENLPPIDMYEKDSKVIVKAELPGIEPEHIDVTVSGNELRISGERKEEKEIREEDYYHSERSYGRIFRTVTLPEGCDADAVKAETKDGVLVVEIARKTTSATKKIDVKKA